jgi:hypothetical protein
MEPPHFTAIACSLERGGDGAPWGRLQLARPHKGNAIDAAMWSEFGPGLAWLVQQGARAVSTEGVALVLVRQTACRQTLEAVPHHFPFLLHTDRRERGRQELLRRD